MIRVLQAVLLPAVLQVRTPREPWNRPVGRLPGRVVELLLPLRVRLPVVQPVLQRISAASAGELPVRQLPFDRVSLDVPVERVPAAERRVSVERLSAAEYCRLAAVVQRTARQRRRAARRRAAWKW